MTIKITKLSKADFERLKKEGRIEKVHFIDPKFILKPRGSMKKESLGLYIFDRLQCAYESWSDPSYSDNPDIGSLLFHLKENLESECQVAWNEFLKMVNSK